MGRGSRARADIFAVARAAGVSISTVSRTFNHPRLVSPVTRRKVEEAVRVTGYIRNRAAQTIHGIRSATIGLVVPTIDHAIFAELVQTFSDTVEAEGFTILLGAHGYDLEREYRILRKFLEHRVDAVAVVGLEHAHESFRLIEKQETPALALWNWAAEAPLPCVGFDNFAAGAMAARHLLGLGHRRIALAFPPVSGNDRATARLAGARKVLAEAGVEPQADWLLTTPYAIGAARAAVGRLLEAGPRPSALLCGNDVIAQGAVHGLMAAGLVPGRDVSVIGVGDFKGSAEMVPALTTVRLPARRIGRLAGRALVETLAGEEPLASRACEIRLEVRETTGPPQG